MRKTLLPVLSLLIAAAILLGANGLQNTLLSLRANMEGFSLAWIGFLTSAFFGGFIAGCRFAPRFIMNVGHVRAFTAFASIASAITLLHSILVEPAVWLVLRVIAGFCFAGLQMIIESWLNEKASNANRGQILSVYRISDFTAVTAGQFLLNLADPSGFVLFIIVSVLISISLVPVALTTSAQPRPIKSARLDLGRLWRVSPLAVAAVLGFGIAGSAFWALIPVVIQDLGYRVSTVALFMSALILGGAVSQWPVGMLSDRLDRRLVIIAIAGGAALAMIAIAFLATVSQGLLVAAGFFIGAFHLPLFGLGIAHANDYAEEDDFVSINGGLLLLYGVGAVLGPILAPLVMGAGGAQSLFYYCATVYALVAGFSLYRMTRRKSVPQEDRGDYRSVPSGPAPAVYDVGLRHDGKAEETGAEAQADGEAIKDSAVI
ncbi:MFS transporter [Aquisalinus flavus]|uniref:MFS transporter n=1 Tax=Aquisalinus flavus TaxID=1526572 RepID=A0A8J2V4G6_9PROT|nr:MFS transporter [Aquisalinus flavus]MBD0426389.1 MFS transporter [Aquisalinus flavus]UNE48050.1 MFS transporter [Aquisalinus flavus]GGD08324.1 MFS transporter [Aquisalinus flavus]